MYILYIPYGLWWGHGSVLLDFCTGAEQQSLTQPMPINSLGTPHQLALWKTLGQVKHISNLCCISCCLLDDALPSLARIQRETRIPAASHAQPTACKLVHAGKAGLPILLLTADGRMLKHMVQVADIAATPQHCQLTNVHGSKHL